MSKSALFETQLLSLTFNGTSLPWANTDLFISLHTADPGESGNQSTAEVAYTGYTRVAVSRDSLGWTVAGNTAYNTAEILFPECVGSPSVVGYLAIGLASSGPSQIIYSGQLGDPMNIEISKAPKFLPGDLLIQEQ